MPRRRSRPPNTYAQLQRAFARELGRKAPDWRVLEDLSRRLVKGETRASNRRPKPAPTVDEIGEE